PSGAEILQLHAQGLLIANATGVAGMVELTRDQSRADVFGLGVGTAFASSTTFVMVLNTTGADQSYELPEGVTIPGLNSSTVTVPGGPPPAGTPGTATTWNETTNEIYFVIHASGSMNFLGDALVVSGDFNMLVTPNMLDMTVSATISVFDAQMRLAGHA